MSRSQCSGRGSLSSPSGWHNGVVVILSVSVFCHCRLPVGTGINSLLHIERGGTVCIGSLSVLSTLSLCNIRSPYVLQVRVTLLIHLPSLSLVLIYPTDDRVCSCTWFRVQTGGWGCLNVAVWCQFVTGGFHSLLLWMNDRLTSQKRATRVECGGTINKKAIR